jgi:Ax21 family sulfation-dependent quorum factor
VTGDKNFNFDKNPQRSRMKRPLLALSLLAALGCSATASAAEGSALSYNYLEGGYVATHSDPADADGFGFNGSAALSTNFHVFGNYAHQDLEDFDADYDQWRVGLGYNHAISPGADLLTRVAYERFDTDGFETNGYSVEAGVRGALAPNFEGYALAGYEDSHDFSGDYYGRLGAQVKFTPNWGLSGDVKFVSGDAQWFVGPRFTW